MSRRTSFDACKQTVESGQRLTAQQGHSLLAYAIKQEESRAREQQQRAESREIELESLREVHTRLAKDWNELVQMLREVLGVHIYSTGTDASGNLLWTVERDGVVVSTGHASVPQAYASVLNMHHSQRDRLTCINRAGTLKTTTE